MWILNLKSHSTLNGINMQMYEKQKLNNYHTNLIVLNLPDI